MDFRVSVSLLAITADKRLSSYDHDYYKILLTEYNTIPTRYVDSVDKDIGSTLESLFKEHLGVAFEWPLKYIGSARKKNKEVEITYICKMPLIENLVRSGKLVNLKDFKMEEYYEKIISGNASEYFR